MGRDHPDCAWHYAYNHWVVLMSSAGSAREYVTGVWAALLMAHTGASPLNRPMIDGDPADAEDHHELCEPLRRLRGWTVINARGWDPQELLSCAM